MHVIAAKAVALQEALQPEFKVYQQKVLDNAKTLAESLIKRGLRIVSGRTDCHLFLLDLRAKNITGKEAETVLGSAHITVNKNAIPNDPQKPMITSGIRLGSPAITTRGFGVAESLQVATWIADVVDSLAEKGAEGDPAVIARVKSEVVALCNRYPVYSK